MVYLLIGFIAGSIASALLWFLNRRSISDSPSMDLHKSIAEKIVERTEKIQVVRTMISGLVPREELVKVKSQIAGLEKEITVEKGRVSITYAELESLEARLRELHEIDRELEASNQEAQEELKALRAREAELKERNDSLKGELQNSLQKIEDLSSELEMSVQMQEKINLGKLELEKAQSVIDSLLQSISEASEVYINMKKRYDALDIEFAQLYDRVSEE